MHIIIIKIMKTAIGRLWILIPFHYKILFDCYNDNTDTNYSRKLINDKNMFLRLVKWHDWKPEKLEIRSDRYLFIFKE